ncbi:MAG: nicotinamide riboside transporter PnuC [Eubacterium sp.]|nr:nicotinamide riboside transporter PnuC [Eubacterium sp.]
MNIEEKAITNSEKKLYKINIVESFKRLTWYELIIWIGSMLITIATFLIFSPNGYLSLISTLIGVTALIFVSKGDVLGQIITVIFSIFYAIVSFRFHYWGEMITYLGMTAPIAMGAVITWIKNPYKKGQVKVSHTSPRLWTFLSISAMIVTTIFYFILKKFNTPNLAVSTVSIATSFMAASLAMFRSSYYAIFYAMNDIVLIILWILASLSNISYLPMVICFFCFLVNDLYGFINWQKMKARQ